MPYTFDSDEIRTYLARRYRQARGRAKSVLRRPASDNNNNFAQRVALTPVSGGSAAFNNTGYTTESGEPFGGGPLFRTGWYSITTTARTIFRFRATSIPVGSTVFIAFYTGTGSPLSGLVHCSPFWYTNDGGDSAVLGQFQPGLGWNAARLNDWMEFQLPAGDIKIQIGVGNSANQGVIAFEWEEQTPPANDDIVDAVEIVDDFGTESGTLVGATWDTTAFPDDFWPTRKDPGGIFYRWNEIIRGVVWYKLTSLDEVSYRFTLDTTGSGEDMRLFVFHGDSTEAEGNGWTRPDEPMYVELDSTEFWIAVVAINLGATGEYDFTRWRDTFDLSWEKLDHPANDYLINAEELVGDNGTSTNTEFVGATLETDEVNDFFPSTADNQNIGTVWFHYVPTTSGRYTLETNTGFGPNLNSLLIIYRGEDMATLERLFDVASQGQFDPGDPLSTPINLLAGESYYFQIFVRTGWNYYAHVTNTDYGGVTWTLDQTAPTNDDFANAEVISGSSGTTSGDTTAATVEEGEFGYPSFDPDPSLASVWYVWQAPSSGYFRFETINGVGDNGNSIFIFTGTEVDALTPVVQNFNGKFPDSPDQGTIIEFEALEGEVYYVRVDSFSATFGAPFDLEWQTASPPTNDLFANATVLASTEAGGPTTYDNLGADEELEDDEPSPTDQIDEFSLVGRSIWFSYTPPTPGLYRFTFDSPVTDGVAAIYELDGAATFDNLTQLMTVYQGFDDTGFLEAQMVTSKTYYIQMLGVGYSDFPAEADPSIAYSVSQGQFAMEWERIPQAPENDDLTSGINVFDAVGNIWNHTYDFPIGEDQEVFRPSGGCYDATSRDATAQAGELSVAGFGPTRTVWFIWQASFTGTAKFWTSSSVLTDQVMAIYQSNNTYNPASPGTLLDSDDDSGPGLMPECQFSTTAFQNYLIQVDTKDNPGGEFSLNWVRVTSSPPINDNFADAIELDTSSEDPVVLSGTTVDSTVECDEPPYDFNGPHGSVWYHLNSDVDRGIQVTLKATSSAQTNGMVAYLFKGSTLAELEDATDFLYPTVFDINDEETVTWQLAGGADYYIAVINRNDNGTLGTGATFDVTYELSSLTPPDGDPFEDPIDSSPSAPGGPIYTGTTEGATTQDGEPHVDDLDIAGTVWHKFQPDFDGIYIFSVDADDPTVGYQGGHIYFNVFEGPSLATVKPIPGYVSSIGSLGWLTANPRVLRGGSTYYVRVERFNGDKWGTYTLNITSYPEYDDWESAGAGYDSVNGSGSYDSPNDTLTYTGPGGALVTPWRDLDDDPQNAGLRWIQMRFKMRITSGETMFRRNRFNALGVVRALDPDDDPVWELILTGNEDGTNSLAIRDPDDGDTRGTFTSFGTRGRDFNEWVDVEVLLRANDARETVPTSYSSEFAVNGVKKRVVRSWELDGVPATAPIRSLEFGAFHYPDSYDTTVSSASCPYQDPHDDWEIQIKDVVVRNRPTLGMIAPTDTGDLGITQFDGWEHEDFLDNINVAGLGGGTATIVDAPGTPPGNADWWKAVRVENSNPASFPQGKITNWWLHNPRPWMGFWVYFAKFPEFPTPSPDSYLIISTMSDIYGGQSDVAAWATLVINQNGELRIAPQLSDTWRSYCVGQLELDTWYWIELEADVGIMHEASVSMSINGILMGTFQFASSASDLAFFTNIYGYQEFPTSYFPQLWELGSIGTSGSVLFGTQSAFGWGGTSIGVEVDMYFAHVCMGRAVTFPLNPMQTKLFGGVDEDADHNIPDLPGDVEDYEHLHTDARPYIWTLYNFTDETDTPNPSVGPAPSEFEYGPPGGGTIDVIADGTGNALIAAFNAIRWAPRSTIPDSPFGTEHFPRHGYTPYLVTCADAGGTTSDMFSTIAWAKGVGDLRFATTSTPGNASMPTHIERTLDGDYEQVWGIAPNAWATSMTSATARVRSSWEGMTTTDFMYWKRVRYLLNPEVYPRFATSADGGATWTFVDDPTITTTNAFIGQDVTVSDGNGVFMNNTSGMKRFFELFKTPGLFNDFFYHSVGYEMTDWYLEYTSVPSVSIPEAEEFGGTRGYNLHMRHGGYQTTPSTSRVEGDLYITIANSTHRSPMHVVTGTDQEISRVRYPTDSTGGHWTTTEFGDTKLRFGYYRRIVTTSAASGTNANPSPSSWVNSQGRGALLEAAQWEVLSEAAPGPAPQRCRRMQQIYRRQFG